MHNLLRLGIMILLLVAGNIVNAAPAVTFRVNCIPSVFLPPGTCFNHTLGQPFTFWVVAMDSTLGLAINYTGTVSITSSDPTATLPSPHTFTASDGSMFGFTITINSLPAGGGDSALVSVAATDANGLTGGGGFYFIAIPQPPIVLPVPILSTELNLVLGVLLSAIAIFSLRRHHRRNS
jgi:hypothetical protein